MKKLNIVLGLVVVLGMLLLSCSQPAPTATPAKPAATSAAPAATAVPTAAAKPTAAPTAAPAVKIPDPLVVTTYEVGGTGYLFAAGIGEAITKATGVKVRAIPTASTPARSSLLTSGRAHLITVGGDILVEGIEEYSKMEWGPQPIRLLYNTFMLGQAMYVRNDSPIQKMSDLKGKKVDLSTRSIAHFHTTACLAFGGLTWDDVDSSVNSPSGQAAADMLKRGQVDAITYTVDATFVLELETAPGGLRALPMPADDVAGWARLHKVAPWLMPRLAQPNEGGGFNGKPTWIWSKSYPTMSALETLPEGVAYFVTKTLMENYALFKDYNPQTKISTPESALDIVGKVIVPYHDGSVRYFKEKGLWTARHDKWNNALIERQAMLKVAFDNALADAATQKVKEANFPAFWMKVKPPLIDVDALVKQLGL